MRLDFTAFSFDFSGQRHPGDGSMEIKAGLRVDEIWRGLSCVLRNPLLSYIQFWQDAKQHGLQEYRDLCGQPIIQTHIWAEMPESHPKPPFLRR